MRKFDIGETVKFGYFSQEGMVFDEQQKVIDVITAIADYIDMGRKSHHRQPIVTTISVYSRTTTRLRLQIEWWRAQKTVLVYRTHAQSQFSCIRRTYKRP